MSQIDFILGPADLTIHRVTGWDHPSVDQSQDQAETLSRRAFTLKWRCCLDERMDLEISRITDCASWHTVVGMEYSTVFNKCSSPVNWEEPDLLICFMVCKDKKAPERRMDTSGLAEAVSLEHLMFPSVLALLFSLSTIQSTKKTNLRCIIYGKTYT